MNNAVVRDLVLLREVELDVVRLALTTPWRAWAQTWGVDGAADVTLTASVAGDSHADLAAQQWQALSPSGGASAAWVHVPAAMRASLAAQLVGRSSKAPLPAQDFALVAAEAALVDLFKRLSEQLQSAQTSAAAYADDEGARAQAWSALSGAVLVTESRSGLQCLLARQSYQSLLPKTSVSGVTKPPIGLLVTLAKQRVPVTLGLGEVDIPVSDLLGLQVGDVIQFPTRLSDELPLSVAAELVPVPALRCQLGQRDGHLAVKLASKTKAA